MKELRDLKDLTIHDVLNLFTQPPRGSLSTRWSFGFYEEYLYGPGGLLRQVVSPVSGCESRVRHTLVGPLWEGYHASRRCSRDTYPESYITKYTSG